VRKNAAPVSRIQGPGIGNRVSESVNGLLTLRVRNPIASIWLGCGGRPFSTTSHPAMIRYRSASPHWRRHRPGLVSPPGKSSMCVVGRITGGFEYVGPAMDRYQALLLAGARASMACGEGNWNS
jgi:hypothetical protein